MERQQRDDELSERDDAEAGSGVPEQPRGMAVYGETDTDPNREDQRFAHQADDEEHV